MTPARFAPGVVSTGAIELNGVVSPDGREFFFTRREGEIFTMYRSQQVGGVWSEPHPLLLYPGGERAMAVDMCCSADGQRLYFLGRHRSELSPSEPGLDLWVSTREGSEWSTAAVLPAPVTSDAMESYPCVVGDGSLYFSSDRPGSIGRSDLYRSQRRPDGSFEVPINVDEPINSEFGTGDSYVAPDESYVIFSSRRPDGFGEGDLYLSSRQPDGTWGEPVSMGETINTERHEFCPMVTPDGKYFFFSRRRSEPVGSGWAGAVECDVYWIDARFLDWYRSPASAGDASRR